MKKLTFKQRLGIIVAFIVAVFLVIPAAKINGPVLVQKGDLVVVNDGVDLKDFNSFRSISYKPTTCTPLNGDLLGLSSTTRNCEGGVYKSNVVKK